MANTLYDMGAAGSSAGDTLNAGNSGVSSLAGAGQATLTTHARTGAFAARIVNNTSNQLSGLWPIPNPALSVAVAVEICWPSTFPTVNATFLTVRSTTGGVQLRLIYNATSGRIEVQDSTGVYIGSAVAHTLQANVWYRIEIVITVGTGANGSAQVRLYHAGGLTLLGSVANTTTANVGTVAPTHVAVGTITTTTPVTVDVENLRVIDASTSWPGITLNAGTLTALPVAATKVGTISLVGTAATDGQAVGDSDDATYLETGTLTGTEQKARCPVEAGSIQTSKTVNAVVSTNTGSATLKLRLFTGSTMVAERTYDGTTTPAVSATPTLFSYALTGPELAAITDWTALSVEAAFTA